MEPIAPVNPVAPYIGGKRLLAKRLTGLIDTLPHDVYAEPFVGMGGVFLRRRRRPRAEVINDLNREVATLYRILQRHYPQLMDTLKFQITSRAEFERLSKTNPETLTDLERAARFLYLQRTGFGGKVTGQNFGVDKARPARFNLQTLGPMLDDLHTRLAGVVIECLPYQDFIARYDQAAMLFYLDPPYWGCERDYGDGFAPEDFERLRDQLAGIEGRFILSINDVPEIRALFADFTLLPVETTYTIGSGKGKRVGELIISNADLEVMG